MEKLEECDEAHSQYSSATEGVAAVPAPVAASLFFQTHPNAPAPGQFAAPVPAAPFGGAAQACAQQPLFGAAAPALWAASSTHTLKTLWNNLERWGEIWALKEDPDMESLFPVEIWAGDAS